MTPAMRSSGGLVGAYVCPRGVYVVVCRRVRGGVDVLREIDAPHVLSTSADAARFLARTLAENGLAGARLCLVVRGFGTVHHILQFPSADDAILRPIIERELRRLEPDLADPVVNYLASPATDVPGRAQVFAAAMPHATLGDFTGELSAQHTSVEHVAVAPQVVRRLYHELDGGDNCTAVILALPDGPLLAFFIDGELRLVVEPPGEEQLDVASLGEEAELGALYLRQQFRGVAVERVAAALGDLESEAMSIISDRLGVPAQRLGDRSGAPAALMALGAVLDAFGEAPLPLAGAALAREQHRRPRPLLVRVAHGVAVAVVVWLSVELVALALTQRELRSVRRSLDAYGATYVRLRDVAARRESGMQSVTALADARLEQLGLRHDLAALRATAPPGVVVDSVSYTRRRDEWAASVSGASHGRTNAQAVQLLHAFYHDLPSHTAAKDLSLDQLDYGDSEGGGPPLVRFRISYTAPPADERD